MKASDQQSPLFYLTLSGSNITSNQKEKKKIWVALGTRYPVPPYNVSGLRVNGAVSIFEKRENLKEKKKQAMVARRRWTCRVLLFPRLFFLRIPSIRIKRAKSRMLLWQSVISGNVAGGCVPCCEDEGPRHGQTCSSSIQRKKHDRHAVLLPYAVKGPELCSSVSHRLLRWG